MVALAAGVLLLGVSASAIAFSLGLRSLTSVVVGVYLIAVAEVVGLTELLSAMHAIGEQGYLLGELAATLVAFFIWSRTRRLPPLPRFPGGLRRHPLIAVLVVVVAATVTYQAFIVLATPPTTWDSLVYHLPRAAQWLQHGSLGYVDAAPTAKINTFPPNGEIEILYTFALAHGYWLAAAPQLLAELVLLVTIFGTARGLGFARSSAAFAALLFPTFSVVALESVSTQNDLVVASFVAAAAMYIVRREPREEALAGLALGLALGTKLTAVFALFPIALLAIVVLRRRAVTLALWSLGAFAAFGAFSYVENVVETGTPLAATDLERFRAEPSFGGTTSTALRVFYRFFDLSGYATVYLAAVVALVVSLVVAMIARGLQKRTEGGRRDALLFAIPVLSPLWILIAALLMRGGFSALHISVNGSDWTATRFRYHVNSVADEDISYFGPLGAALLVPLALIPTVNWLRGRRDAVRLVLGSTLFLFVIELAVVYKYNAWIGRFTTLPCALCAPLLAVAYRHRWLAGGAVVAGVLTLSLAHSFSVTKPAALGATPIWSMTQSETVAISSNIGPRTSKAIESALRGHTRIGAVLGPDDPGFILFGTDLRRKVVYLPRTNSFAEAQRRGLDFVLFGRVRHPLVEVASATDWRLSQLPGGWLLATKPPASSTTPLVAAFETDYLGR
jgi:Glycosyltransferase family 87